MWPAAALLCFVVSSSVGLAQPGDPAVTTRHQIVVGGKPLAYTAEAGRIPIIDNDAGEVHANMFYVAYRLDRSPGVPPRPLTFLWNGGPGSNAGLVHLLGFGPKRVAPASGSAPRLSPAGTALVDNQETWLTFTDLVFVDPVGTGYSRPAKPEFAAEFYQTPGDAESVAEFIRVYRTRHDAFDAPLYVAGESYGVTRCALVAEALERRRTHLSGVVMISGLFPLDETPPHLRSALWLPTLTAAAHANRKLPADLQSLDLPQALRASEEYAKGEYAAALAEAATATEARRDSVVANLVRFTGLLASQIDRKTLVVPYEQLSADLLADKYLVVARYDSRLTGPRSSSPQYDPTTDPSLKDILDPVSTIRYLRNTLGYKSDLLYQGPFGGGYPPPAGPRGDWMSVRWKRPNTSAQSKGLPSASKEYRAALTANPKLRTLVAHGYYDLVMSYFATERAVLGLPADLAGRITVRSYPGGHAIYTDGTVRRQFRRDAMKFYQPEAGK
jgi:carboxypeptidase C (cathepsin A)